MLKHSKFLLLGVILLAAVLRFYQPSVPPSLNWDEISHGYNAYSILKSGKDEWGGSWPTIFRAYGDYKLPVYIYMTALFEAVFGLNSLAVRLPSILAGVGLVFFTYLLTKRLFSLKAGLLAAFLVAIEPWSFFVSRGAFEANLGAFFVVAGIYYLILGIEKARFLVWSSILLGLSVFTYNSARVFVPLFLVFFFFLYRSQFRALWQKRQKHLTLSLIVLGFFLGGMFWQMIAGDGRARYRWLAILDEGAIASIEHSREVSTLPEGVERLIYNKPVYFAEKFAKNYISHFSPEFLFLKGGDHYQFNVPGHGLLYLVNLPFSIFGLVTILRHRRKEGLVVLGWLMLAPVASSLTRESPHVLRAITFLPVPMLLVSLGFIEALDFVTKSRKKLLILGTISYLLATSLFAFKYFGSYFTGYLREYSWSWQYGYKEIVDYAKTNYDRYDQIVVTKKYGEPHEFFLYYWPWDPETYRNDPKLARYPQSDWFWVDSFDKFVFVNDWDIPKTNNEGWKTERGVPVDMSKKTLLITSPDTYPEGWKKLGTIRFLDNKPAFDILENDVKNNKQT